MTGLQVTGGVPPSIAPDNINWNHHVQEISTDPFASRNDGGAGYQPSCDIIWAGRGFCSDANNSGTNLFSYADDGVPMSDPNVAAAIKFDQDVLDAYEKMMANVGPSGMAMIYHSGATEDGSCTPNAAGCDWLTSGDGGFHYSIFALTKGLGGYISPDSSDPNNWYAKVVDLLLTQQNADGSWPVDPRDDFSIPFATGLAVAALGRVAVLKDASITGSGDPVKTTEGQKFSGNVASFNDPDGNSQPSEYSATIDWGDGSSSAGTISGSGGNYTVSGSHTYAEEGSHTVKVTITDTDNSSNALTTSASATVADAALHAVGNSPSVSGKTASGTVASFGDNDPNGTRSDYTASINWGDGTTTHGTVTKGPSPFDVEGSHTYSKSGTYTVTTTIRDAGGSTATAKTTVTIPAQQVKAARVSARLSGAPACVSGAFVSRVSGNRIASVRFTLDGRQQRTRTVRRGSQYAARIAVSAGRHSLTVKVKFRSGSSARSRTFHRTVRGCPPPMFTG
jgi:hypothetical protein